MKDKGTTESPETFCITEMLLPLSLTSLLWIFILSVLPLKTAITDWSIAWSLTKEILINNPEGYFSTQFFNYVFLGFPATFFAFWLTKTRFARISPAITTISLYILLPFIGLLTSYLQQVFSARETITHLPLSLLFSTFLGHIAWKLMGHDLIKKINRITLNWSNINNAWCYLTITFSIILILIPNNNEINLAHIWQTLQYESLYTHISSIPQLIYTSYKGVMLWIPLGLIATIAKHEKTTALWVFAALVSLTLQAISQTQDLIINDFREMLYAPIGLWLGVWLGKNSRAEYSREKYSAKHMETQNGKDSIKQNTSSTIKNKKHITLDNLSTQIHSASYTSTAILRTFSVLLTIMLVFCVQDFPRSNLTLAAGLGLYILILYKYPYSWLLLLPATLPLLDFAPWTGRFYFDVFDMLLVSTVITVAWRAQYTKYNPPIPRLFFWILLLSAVCWLISTLTALFPFTEPDINSFNNYWSQYNSLRIAKGFCWAMIIFCLIRWTLPFNSTRIRNLFFTGICIGLIGTVFIALRERWQFAGLFNLGENYRITATFSSMHTGGGHIEAYLISTIPFLWYWSTRLTKTYFKVAIFILLCISIYAAVITISRGAILAIGTSLIVLIIGSIRKQLYAGYSSLKSTIVPVSILIIIGLSVLTATLSDSYFQKRFSQTTEDIHTRLSHWKNAIAMMDNTWKATLIGMGLGKFPISYLERNPEGKVPGTYRYIIENNNTFLRLGSGETLYMAQRIPIKNNENYTITLSMRSKSSDARLTIPVCEKHLLNSYQCVWNSKQIPSGNNQWQPVTIKINTRKIGKGNWFSKRPIEISLYNSGSGSVIDVDNIHLLDNNGQDIIQNGDFTRNGDNWFFKTHSHLPWHIKNLWVQIYFEQGILGLSIFTLLIATAFYRLFISMWHGNDISTITLASTTGFLTVGLFGSLFDAPRLTFLFFSILFIGFYNLATVHSVPNNKVNTEER